MYIPHLVREHSFVDPRLATITTCILASFLLNTTEQNISPSTSLHELWFHGSRFRHNYDNYFSLTNHFLLLNTTEQNNFPRLDFMSYGFMDPVGK